VESAEPAGDPDPLAAAFNGVVLLRAAIAQRLWPRAEALLLGAVVNFLDTLGIGSMAPAMAWFTPRHRNARETARRERTRS
jgi:hypothetical protein